jgi:thioredoxin 1
MSKTGRIIVVVVLALAVAGILVARHRRQSGAALSGGLEPNGLPLLLDLGAGKCTACSMMEDVLAGLEQEFSGSLRVRMIDVSQHPGAKEAFGIRMIPTQIFYDGEGQELFRHEGFMGRVAILEKWKEFGIRLAPGSLVEAGSVTAE